MGEHELRTEGAGRHHRERRIEEGDETVDAQRQRSRRRRGDVFSQIEVTLDFTEGDGFFVERRLLLLLFRISGFGVRRSSG